MENIIRVSMRCNGGLTPYLCIAKCKVGSIKKGWKPVLNINQNLNCRQMQNLIKLVFWSLQTCTLSHVSEFALVIQNECIVLQACSFTFSDPFLVKSQFYKKFYIYYLTISFDYWCPGLVVVCHRQWKLSSKKLEESFGHRKWKFGQKIWRRKKWFECFYLSTDLMWLQTTVEKLPDQKRQNTKLVFFHMIIVMMMLTLMIKFIHNFDCPHQNLCDGYHHWNHYLHQYDLHQINVKAADASISPQHQHHLWSTKLCWGVTKVSSSYHSVC